MMWVAVHTTHDSRKSQFSTLREVSNRKLDLGSRYFKDVKIENSHLTFTNVISLLSIEYIDKIIFTW